MPTTVKRKTLVFAGNRQQGETYASDNGLSIRDYRIVLYDGHVLGISPDNFDHVCVGTWAANVEVKRAYKLWQDKLRIYGARATRSLK